MPSRYKKWVWMLLTALGVGTGTAARCAGCESGVVDDAKTVVRDGVEIPNPNYGECVSFE